LEGGLKAVPANFLALERSVAVVVNMLCIPERVVEFPKKVNEFTNPERAGEVTAINDQGEKE
jgi:hypothetical protein